MGEVRREKALLHALFFRAMPQLTKHLEVANLFLAVRCACDSLPLLSVNKEIVLDFKGHLSGV